MDLLLPLLLVALLVPMFLGVRRQKREMAKVTEMQDSLKVGDRVTTTSGLYGTVVDLDDLTVDLEIAEDVVTTWLRQSIREVRADEVETTESTELTEAATVEETPAQTAERIESTPSDETTRLTKD
ncbi:preprotein translocase subunit YajC [Nocardia otitidiscaviarum]|uniref:Preprotein translocase subunit YajC n=1 Tax=Nocardia otitidiscaviarum TaxID=1823 RepID=A0A516NN10_9NOCA|nr:preprotein translocase subunit YajC [Nocardia otitidiscaviarum]MCP9624452.1 preprotein translocase subunit YajC [Nocardia otitidiscaviarum]QDP80296.1 preprotein translocase subunit YajC [Nocardia otitidiscaviarum]